MFFCFFFLVIVARSGKGNGSEKALESVFTGTGEACRYQGSCMTVWGLFFGTSLDGEQPKLRTFPGIFCYFLLFSCSHLPLPFVLPYLHDILFSLHKYVTV